jgi:hypothetical protein
VGRRRSDDTGRLSPWDGPPAGHPGTVQPAVGEASPAFLPDRRTVSIADENALVYERDTFVCRIVGASCLEARWIAVPRTRHKSRPVRQLTGADRHTPSDTVRHAAPRLDRAHSFDTFWLG